MAASNQPWQGGNSAQNVRPAAAWFGGEGPATRGALPSPMGQQQPWDATQAPWAGFNSMGTTMDTASRFAAFAALSQLAGLPQADPRTAAPQEGGGYMLGPPGALAARDAQDALRQLKSAEQDVLAHQQRLAIHERAAQEAQAKLAEARKHLSSLGFSGSSAASSASAGWPAAAAWSAAQEASPSAAHGAQMSGYAYHHQARTEAEATADMQAYAAASEAAGDLLPADSTSGEGDGEAGGQNWPGAPAMQGEAESEAEVGQDIEDAVAAFLAGEADDEGSDEAEEEDARPKPARRQPTEPRPAERAMPVAGQPLSKAPEPQPAIPQHLVTPVASAAKQYWTPTPAQQHQHQQQQPGSAHAQAQGSYMFGSRGSTSAMAPSQSPHPQLGQFSLARPDWAAALEAGDPLLGSSSRQQALLRWGELCGAGVASVGALVHRFNRAFMKPLPSEEFDGFSVSLAASAQGLTSEVRWAAYVQAQRQQQQQQPVRKPPGLENPTSGMDGDAQPFVPMATSSPSSSAARVGPTLPTSQSMDKAALKAKAAPQATGAKSSSPAAAPQHTAFIQAQATQPAAASKASVLSTPQTPSPAELEAGDESSGDEGAGPEAQSIPIRELLREMTDEKTSTVVVRNLPRQCSQQLILQKLVETGFAGLWDFCYMPCTFSTGASKGYCFINFTSHAALIAITYMWHGKRLFGDSALNVSRAEVQGREANIRKWDAPRMRRVRNPLLKPVVVLDATLEYDESLGDRSTNDAKAALRNQVTEYSQPFFCQSRFNS